MQQIAATPLAIVEFDGGGFDVRPTDNPHSRAAIEAAAALRDWLPQLDPVTGVLRVHPDQDVHGLLPELAGALRPEPRWAPATSPPPPRRRVLVHWHDDVDHPHPEFAVHDAALGGWLPPDLSLPLEPPPDLWTPVPSPPVDVRFPAGLDLDDSGDRIAFAELAEFAATRARHAAYAVGCRPLAAFDAARDARRLLSLALDPARDSAIDLPGPRIQPVLDAADRAADEARTLPADVHRSLATLTRAVRALAFVVDRHPSPGAPF